MNKEKICIVGNSVALRCRPTSNTINYGNILSKANYNVVNLSFGRATSKEVLILKDTYIRTFSDWYIINLGCVDAPSREVPLWVSDVIYGRRKTFLSNFVVFFYWNFISKNRRVFTLLRLKKSWIKKESFIRNVSTLITSIQKDTNAGIIVLGINSGNNRIEKILPGTTKKYKEYNHALKQLVKELNIPFIEVSDLSSSEYFPDGVHYNSAGHNIISSRILNIMQK